MPKKIGISKVSAEKDITTTLSVMVPVVYLWVNWLVVIPVNLSSLITSTTSQVMVEEGGYKYVCVQPFFVHYVEKTPIILNEGTPVPSSP